VTQGNAGAEPTRCYACGKPLEQLVGKTVRRSDTCEHCGADVHCCRNCRFHDPYAPNQCREPTADYVADREKANFCDDFSLGRASSDRYATAAEESKRRLEALFKK
jgi:hypothetical protein